MSLTDPLTIPVQPDSRWPTFRHDQRNSGRSSLAAVYHGDLPWAFQTGKGVFSTPVIDGQGTIYVGSGDHYFYALHPDGTVKWKYKTGEIIDSAAALARFDPQTGDTVTFISGDGFMYHFRSRDTIASDGIADDVSSIEERLVWKFEAQARPGVSFNRWFEGNVAIGPDGTLYAGNTNFNYYAIHPDGSLKWTYSTGSNNWSQAAFGDDGTIYWGSVDTFIRAVSPAGVERWRKRTLGFIAASAAIGSDGTVYIGSFDSNLYALEPVTGRVRWKFATQDHIYSSAALGADAAGNTNAIYFGSADGNLYAISPNGKLLWKYDTGAPIRSSPVTGLTPDGQEIVYFGSGNGRLYALNAADGSLRWAYDTTPDDPELQDRNDLNGSPALGDTGVYIGGEHGFVCYVPYDYPLHVPDDPRCSSSRAEFPAAGLPPDFTGLYYVSPGGNASPDFPKQLDAATQITLRLVVRRGSETLPARLYNNPLLRPKDALQATVQPAFPFDLEHSADGKYIYLRPRGFLQPGQTYTLTVSGRYYTGGWRIGNLTLGGSFAGRFAQSFQFRVREPALPALPLKVTPEATTALVWTRLAAPLPTMLPSLNQLGFDYIYWIIGAVEVTSPDAAGQGKCILWAIGAKQAADGSLVVDPASDFTLPLSGHYQGSDFILANRRFKMAITGIPIPFNLFELRGQLGSDLIVRPGATTFADAKALSIPNFGPYLVIAGLANNWWEKLLVAGTYITRPYPSQGAANMVPKGITVERLDYQPPAARSDGRVRATFHLEPGAAYPLSQHCSGLLLVDAERVEAVPLDYHANLLAQATEDGNLHSVRLLIPKGTPLPSRLRAYVMLDVFPFHRKEL
jgi:outer membrane protein assembly factor BamB